MAEGFPNPLQVRVDVRLRRRGDEPREEACRLRLYFEDTTDDDPAPAAEFLRNEGRALAQSLISVNSLSAGWENTAPRIERFTGILTQSGVPALSVDDLDSYWEQQMPAILDWARDRVAHAVSTAAQPIGPDELSFWPRGEDYERQAAEITTSDESVVRMVDLGKVGDDYFMLRVGVGFEGEMHVCS